MSELKIAFQNVRQHRNIELLLPTFSTLTLYVVGRKGLGLPDAFDFAMTTSPRPGEYCVTAAEVPGLLRFDNWDLKALTGQELLDSLAPGVGVLFNYGDGGDYLSGEQIAWLRGCPR